VKVCEYWRPGPGLSDQDVITGNHGMNVNDATVLNSYTMRYVLSAKFTSADAQTRRYAEMATGPSCPCGRRPALLCRASVRLPLLHPKHISLLCTSQGEKEVEKDDKKAETDSSQWEPCCENQQASPELTHVKFEWGDDIHLNHLKYPLLQSLLQTRGAIDHPDVNYPCPLANSPASTQNQCCACSIL
jgi:hypothetical protein